MPDDLAWQDVGRTDPKMRKKMDEWAQNVAERAPESENIQDRRAGESAFDYYTGKIADKAKDIWSNITEPYQAGGSVAPAGREPVHAAHNRMNQRMIANVARRDPRRAKWLMQGLRREHNGYRAMATVALAHGHGLRSVNRHELAHGHDAHALHLLNMAHSKVPDGAEITFTQHGDHTFNAHVNRKGRRRDFPLNRRQLMEWSIGPAGDFDHSVLKGAEKNLRKLSRNQSQQQRGYDEGGVVEYQDGGDVDVPATGDPDTSVVQWLLRSLYSDHGADQSQAGYGEQESQPLIAPVGGRTALARGIGFPESWKQQTEPTSAQLEQQRQTAELATTARVPSFGIPGPSPLHGKLRDLLYPNTSNSASDAELERERLQGEMETTIRKPEEIPAVLRGGREGRVAEPPIQYKGATPEEVTAALGPQAGEATRREIERISRESGNRPVDVVRSGRAATEAVPAVPARTEPRLERVPATGPISTIDTGGIDVTSERPGKYGPAVSYRSRPPSAVEYPRGYETVETQRQIPGTGQPAQPAQPAVAPYQITAQRPGEIGYTPRAGEEGYVVSGTRAPATTIPLTPGRSDADVREAGRRFPNDIRAQEEWLQTRPRDPNIPTPEQDVAAREAAGREFQQRMLLQQATEGKGKGAGVVLEAIRGPRLQRQFEEQEQLKRDTLAQRVNEELGKGSRLFTAEAGKGIRQKLKDDPSGRSLTPDEVNIVNGVIQRAQQGLEGGVPAAPAAPAIGGVSPSSVTTGWIKNPDGTWSNPRFPGRRFNAQGRPVG